MEAPEAIHPSRQAVIEMVRGLEPGSNPDLVIVKDCNTRFGMAMTTGRAYVYANAEAMSVEPAYIHKRHEDLTAAPPSPLQKTTEVRLDGRQVAEGQGVQVRGR